MSEINKFGLAEHDDVRKIVREGYARIAQTGESCCGPVQTCGCCGTEESISKDIGYTDEDINKVPEGANLGLGCGNPIALASLKEGEIVIDLGSGAGFDCFLAAEKVGDSGKVVGVDMTPAMIEKARENAKKGNYKNVEFRLGEIENLPVADNFADIIISNCVINLSPHKDRVFQEAFRVLKPGGRLMVSDIVLLTELPDFIKNSATAYISCVAGAILKEQYLHLIRQAGFEQVEVIDEIDYPVRKLIDGPAIKAAIDNLRISDEEIDKIVASIKSIKVRGFKPATK